MNTRRRLEALATSIAAATAVLFGSMGCEDPDRSTSSTLPAQSTSPPNVVLIVIDTLRADFLGAYGFGADTSPNLDALARKSMVFDRAVAASTLTAPSHASMMTSRYVREHSIGYLNGGTRLVDLATLASVFQDAGYETAAFVSNNVLQSRIGLDQGFDVYDDALPEAERNRPYVFERTAPGTTARALEWLAERDGRPFFLWVHYQDPHGPYTPPEELANAFSFQSPADDKPLPVLDRQHGLRGIPAYQALPGLRFAHEYRERYAAEIRYFDESLGRLLSALAEHESSGGTVLLLTADHGESLGEGGYYFAHGHATTPDLARIPLMISAPGIAPGRNGELVHHVDIMPTLLDLANLPSPANLRGLALAPLLEASRPFPDRIVYSDVGNDVSGYRRDSFVRLIESGQEVNSETDRWQAYIWRHDGGLAPAIVDEETRSAMTAYLENATPTVEAEELEPDDIERLRALGYVDPAD